MPLVCFSPLSTCFLHPILAQQNTYTRAACSRLHAFVLLSTHTHTHTHTHMRTGKQDKLPKKLSKQLYLPDPRYFHPAPPNTRLVCAHLNNFRPTQRHTRKRLRSTHTHSHTPTTHVRTHVLHSTHGPMCALAFPARAAVASMYLLTGLKNSRKSSTMTSS
jgi:hypothetical protein